MPSRELIIIGGGPAGSFAALAAGRALRKATVIDNMQARNRSAMHNFISREDVAPLQFRRGTREQITPKSP